MEQPRVVLDVGGVSVAVRAVDGYLRFVTDRVGVVESMAEASLTLAVTPVPPNHPDRPPDQRMEMVDAWFEGDTVWMKIGDAVAEITPNQVKIGGSIDNPVDYKSIDLIVQFGMAAAVVAPDRIMVHGAVVARGDSALLVVGGSGRGKSTAATAALVYGWDLLTDDLAIANPAVGSVRGVARPPRLPAGVAECHGITGRIETGERGRIVLPATSLSPGSRNLVGLVIVDHGEFGRLVALAPGDLHAIDDALAVPPFRPVLRRHLAPAAALVSMPTFRLSHAADETLRIDRAAELLDEAMRSALGAREAGGVQ